MKKVKPEHIKDSKNRMVEVTYKSPKKLSGKAANMVKVIANKTLRGVRKA